MALMRFSLILILLVGCGGFDPKRVEALYGGKEKMEMVRSPGKVEAFRISPPSISTQEGFLDWPVTAGPIPLESKAATRLSTTLLDPGTYGSPGKLCRVTPGVKLRFSGPSANLDVFLCFECDILVVFEGRAMVGKADVGGGERRGQFSR